MSSLSHSVPLGREPNRNDGPHHVCYDEIITSPETVVLFRHKVLVFWFTYFIRLDSLLCSCPVCTLLLSSAPRHDLSGYRWLCLLEARPPCLES